MEKFKRHSSRPDAYDVDAASTAEAVQRDFSDLIAIFDRHLANMPDGESQTRSHVAKAKAAAERGLKLSEKLIEVLGR